MYGSRISLAGAMLTHSSAVSTQTYAPKPDEQLACSPRKPWLQDLESMQAYVGVITQSSQYSHTRTRRDMLRTVQ